MAVSASCKFRAADVARSFQETPTTVIVVAEGPSVAGKTTWIARHRGDPAVICDDAGGIEVFGVAFER